MSLMDKIKEKARQGQKHIVLAEGTEPRTIKAAAQIAREGIARVTLLGNANEIAGVAGDLSLEGVNIVDPAVDGKRNEYVNALYNMRKEKGVTMEKADDLLNSTLYYGVMMVKLGDADGMVAGAINSTGDVLRPALQIIKPAKGITAVSSCFLMECPNKDYGDNGIIAFADCAVIPNPTANEMAAIAIASAKTTKAMAGIEPRVAMLSFSTKGSAKHELADKVIEATRIAKELAPELMIDGELQADAALVASVGELKCPGSPVAGKANVLVFPDLQAGNIGYKLVQRIAGADAIGPVIQGLAMPVNDLSRGCSVEDIVSVAAITAVQAIG